MLKAKAMLLWAQMQNLFYQITHPWHWLTYGQNATAVAAITAIAGIIGLFFYTKYTRRMMELAEETSRANVSPTLALSGDIFTTGSPQAIDLNNPIQPNGISVHLRIKNVSNAPVVFIMAWAIRISREFKLKDQSLYPKTPKCITCRVTKRALMGGEEFQVIHQDVPQLLRDEPWLYVIQIVDSTNRIHQLQVHLYGDEGEMTSVSMVHEPLDVHAKKSQYTF